jgi:site-specific DNA recombinase
MSDQTDRISPNQLLGVPQDNHEDFDAVIYARTSSVNQKFGYSLDEQVRQCWERCKMLGWRVIRVFKDEAESGDDTDRPKFQKMMSLARGGRFNVVVFWKLDRFSRSILHAVELERELREHDIALHSVTEQLDTSTPSGRFNFRNIASAAEFEREHIKQRSQMGFKALALQYGWPNQTPPFGYDRNDDATLAVNQQEAEIVRSIFERYLELRSMPEVAAELNERDSGPEGETQWTARRVNKILRNEIYCGRYSVADVSEDVPEYRIVSPDMFDAVVKVRHRFRRSDKPRQSKMPKDRKDNSAERILNSYRDFLDANC